MAFVVEKNVLYDPIDTISQIDRHGSSTAADRGPRQGAFSSRGISSSVYNIY